MAKAFTPSVVAWLLVLAAVLWFGGNYIMDRVYEQRAKSALQLAVAQILAGQPGHQYSLQEMQSWVKSCKETPGVC